MGLEVGWGVGASYLVTMSFLLTLQRRRPYSNVRSGIVCLALHALRPLHSTTAG